MSNNSCTNFRFNLSKELCPLKDDLVNWLEANCKKWIFQLELSDPTENNPEGYEHWEGRFSLRKKRRKTELIKILGKREYMKTCHVSYETYTNDDDFYVTKEDTRIDGPWANTDKVIYIPRQCREVMNKWRPWQQQIIEDIGKWNTRTINVILDPTGSIGKSTFVGYLNATNQAMQVPPLNDMKDLLGLVCDAPTSKMYLIDMPRALKKDKLGGLYSGIESIKSGFAYDIRYQYKSKNFDCPNIWIFTNTQPDLDMLSPDRWKIWTVNKKDWSLKLKLPYLKEVELFEKEFLRRSLRSL